MFGYLVLTVSALIDEANARKEWIDSLPKDEADKIREDDARKRREEELHRRALQIADAGRARNFWGK
jgi:hypothetical protein